MLAGDLLGHRARLTPEKLALVEIHTGARLSYAELDAETAKLARIWKELWGLPKGARVGILSHNRREFIEAFFAAGKSGICLVPLGTRLTASELAPICRDAGLSALLYESGFGDAVKVLRKAVDVPYWACIDGDPIDGGASLAELRAGIDGEFTSAECRPEDLYCLLYTSGTTGRPKGVMIPHRQVLWNGFNTVACWQLREDDISPIFTPLYHAGALGAFLVPLVTIGGTIVLHRGFDPEEIWRAIEGEGSTVVLGVPTIFRMLMEHPLFHTTRLDRVRWFISGGAPLPASIIEAYQQRGVPFKQGYGMTEVGVNCFSMTVEESVRKAGSIGKPMLLNQTRILSKEGHEAVPGEVGELQFRGPQVCLGYWNQPEVTAAAFDDEGWFHTGDLARRDEEGFYYIAGRCKEMIISGGVNIYPAEIEAAILRHSEVKDAVVVGVPDPRWGEAGVAFVVPVSGASVDEEQLLEFLAGQMGRYKLPKRIQFREELPRTSYGKVKKGELRQQFEADDGCD